MSELGPHVQQALNELDNGVAHGQDDAVMSARKRLAAAGVTEREARAALRGEAASTRRAAVEEEAARELKDKPPQGRQSPAAKRATT